MIDFYTPNEVAKLFKVELKTVYRWTKDGTLKGVVRIHRTVRIPFSAIDPYLREINQGD